jgi:hypothetical protein
MVTAKSSSPGRWLIVIVGLSPRPLVPLSCPQAAPPSDLVLASFDASLSTTDPQALVTVSITNPNPFPVNSVQVFLDIDFTPGAGLRDVAASITAGATAGPVNFTIGVLDRPPVFRISLIQYSYLGSWPFQQLADTPIEDLPTRTPVLSIAASDAQQSTWCCIHKLCVHSGGTQ